MPLDFVIHSVHELKHFVHDHYFSSFKPQNHKKVSYKVDRYIFHIPYYHWSSWFLNFMAVCDVIFFAIPYGLGAGAIDASVNHYVANNYSGSVMNFLHCFYGVGSVISPSIMALALKYARWNEGYRWTAVVQIVILLVCILSLPLWKRNLSGYHVAAVGFVVIGTGMGPVYPAIQHMAPANFGQRYSAAVIGLQMASAYVGSTFMPMVFGLLQQAVGIGIMPVYLLLFAVMNIVFLEQTYKVIVK